MHWITKSRLQEAPTGGANHLSAGGKAWLFQSQLFLKYIQALFNKGKYHDPPI